MKCSLLMKVENGEYLCNSEQIISLPQSFPSVRENKSGDIVMPLYRSMV